MILALKILHFLCFAAATGTGLANLIAGRHLGALMPEGAPVIAPFRGMLGQIATTGLVLLWITGFALLYLSYDSSLWRNPGFLVKIALVLGLSYCSLQLNLRVIRATKTRTPPDPVAMHRYGFVGSLCALSAIVVAVALFN